MISLTNYDFQWARSELVIIYPDDLYRWVRVNPPEVSEISEIQYWLVVLTILKNDGVLVNGKDDRMTSHIWNGIWTMFETTNQINIWVVTVFTIPSHGWFMTLLPIFEPVGLFLRKYPQKPIASPRSAAVSLRGSSQRLVDLWETSVAAFPLRGPCVWFNYAETYGFTSNL